MAFVLSVTERGRPVSEHKLDAFRGRLMSIMDGQGEGIVRTWRVRPSARSARTHPTQRNRHS